MHAVLSSTSPIVRHAGFLGVLLVAAVCTPALADDVTRPAAVSNLVAAHVGSDGELGWDAVTLYAAGQPETIDHYKVYLGNTPDFVPDKAGGSNLIGTPSGELFTDVGAAAGPEPYFYLVSAVDTAGNESDTKSALLTTPTLSAFWTTTSIEVDWTDSDAAADLVAYRVYYGKHSGEYEFVDDVGLSTSHSITGLELFVNWYIAVTALAVYGNERTYEQAASDTGIPLGSLKRHLREGLARLREQFSENL